MQRLARLARSPRWAIVAVLLCLPAASRAATIAADWVNAATGTWTDAANWSSNPNFPDNGAPLPSDTYDVTIAATGASYTVTLNSNITIDNLDLDSSDATLLHTTGVLEIVDTVDLLDGTYRVDGGTLQGGTWNVAGGTLSFANDSNNRLDGATVNGNLDLTTDFSDARLLNGATFSGQADLANGANLGVTDSLTLDGVTVNVGVGPNEAVTNADSFGVGGNNVLTLGPSTQVNLRGANSRVTSDLFVGGNGMVVNQGTIDADAGGASYAMQIFPDVFVNQGTVSAQNGAQLDITSTTWTNTASGQIVADGITLDLGGSWSNQGTIDLNDVTLNLSGNFSTSDISSITRSGTRTTNLIGNLDNNGDTLALDASTGSFTVDGGDIIGGTVTQSDGEGLVFANDSGNLLNGTTVIGGLDLQTDFSDAQLVNGATFTGTADLGNGAILGFTDTITLDNVTVNVDGGSATNADSFGVSGNNTLTLGPNTVVNLRGGNSRVSSDLFVGGIGTVVNQGSIDADGGGAVRDMQIFPDFFVNEGTVSAQNGAQLDITSSSWSNAASGQIIADGVTLDLGGSWTNQGSIDLNDVILNLSGSFSTSDISSITRTGTRTTNLIGNLDNNGDTLALDASTGSFTVDGGDIIGGTVTQADGEGLVFANDSGNLLNGATVIGDLDLQTDFSDAQLVNGATFTGTADLGNGAILGFTDTITLDNVTVNVDGGATTNADSFGVSGNNTLTLGPNTVVNLRGGNSRVTSDLFIGGNGTVVNQGSIDADGGGANRDMQIFPDVFVNEGSVSAQNGANLDITSSSWSNAAGGQIVADGVTLDLGGSWTNQGSIDLNDVLLNLSGSFSTSDISSITRTGTRTTNLIGNLDNNGDTLALDASTGSFTVDGGDIIGGTVTQADGEGLVFANDSGNLLNGTTVVGDLDLQTDFSDAQLVNGATFTGTADLGNGAALGFNDTITIDDVTVNVDGGATTNADFFGVGGNNVLTLGPNTQVNLLGANSRVTSDLFVGGIGVVVNQGTIDADAGGASRSMQIQSDFFTNEGTVSARDTATLSVGCSSCVTTNLTTPGTLTGGSWQVFQDSTLELFGNPAITTNRADVTLSGTNSSFASIDSLQTNDTGGAFRLAQGRTFNAAGALTNRGLVELDDATLVTSALGNESGGSVTGEGTVDGNTTSSGVLSPGIGDSVAELAFTGDLTLLGSSFLDIQLESTPDGMDPANSNDFFDVVGDVALDGILALSFLGDFDSMVSASDVFVLVESQADITGDFANVAIGERVQTAGAEGSFEILLIDGAGPDPDQLVATNFEFTTVPALGALGPLPLALALLAAGRVVSRRRGAVGPGPGNRAKTGG